MRIVTAVRYVRGGDYGCSPVVATRDMASENTIELLDHGFVRLDAAMADDLSVVNGARVSFARRKTEMDDSDEALDPLPHARQARKPVRAQRLPLPRPVPDLRRTRMVPPPGRLVQRIQLAIREGVGGLLPSGARGRTHPGGKARRILVRAGRRQSLRSTPASGSRRSTTWRSRAYEELVEAGRRARARPVRAAGRRVHAVLLDRERTVAHELHLAAELRVRPARDPALRGGSRVLLRRGDAGHVRFVRRGRSRSSLSGSRTPKNLLRLALVDRNMGLPAAFNHMNGEQRWSKEKTARP